MIGSRDPGDRQDFAGKRTETALHPVPDDSAANLLRDRDPKPDRRIRIAAIADQQHETRHWRAAAIIGRQEIRAPRECC
jgi:hypothetical protein